MLGWLKRNAPPVPDPPPVERVGRLLGRLLTEHRSAEEHAAEQHATGALDFAEPSTETEARALDRQGPEGNNVERLPVADRGIVAPPADDDILDLVNPLPRPAGEAVEEAVEETAPEAI